MLCPDLGTVCANLLLYFEGRHPAGEGIYFGEIIIKRGVKVNINKMIASSLIRAIREFRKLHAAA
jgi:hypothetical protein